ncbi:uncharacterized protein LOC119094489 [Pollicipes pollicipes]|uniref:uncharacterized protein LOC119094489 n=1 Tax=Pollicipes pollicipes TaxID=41117 RepID=UPI001884C754|nr:uncharacterized protein LOC119094489 [Pollicipes pollicipes]
MTSSNHSHAPATPENDMDSAWPGCEHDPSDLRDPLELRPCSSLSLNYILPDDPPDVKTEWPDLITEGVSVEARSAVPDALDDPPQVKTEWPDLTTEEASVEARSISPEPLDDEGDDPTYFPRTEAEEDKDEEEDESSSRTPVCETVEKGHSISIQRSSHKKAFTKRNICPYCSKTHIKFARHLFRRHKTKPEVVQALTFPKGSKERRICVQHIINRGNFKHNLTVFRDGHGTIIPRRCPPQNAKVAAKDMVPCSKCQGFFSRRCLPTHSVRCHAGEKDAVGSEAQARTDFPRTEADEDKDEEEDESSSRTPVCETLEKYHSISIQRSSQKKTSLKRNVCPYCSKTHIKFARHLFRRHKMKPEVVQALAFPKGSRERRICVQHIINRGNFKHNLTVFHGGHGTIIPKRCPPQNANVTAKDMVPCSKCQAFFSRRCLPTHNVRCHAGEKAAAGREVQALGRSLPPCHRHASAGLEKLMANMWYDDVTSTCSNDGLIFDFGSRLFTRLGHEREQHAHIREKMRQLGRLVLELNQSSPGQGLESFIQRSKFLEVVGAVKRLAGGKKGKCRNLSLALKLGISLGECAEILRTRGIDNDDAALKAAAGDFLLLYRRDWKVHMSSRALHEKSEGEPVERPLGVGVQSEEVQDELVRDQRLSEEERSGTNRGQPSEVARESVNRRRPAEALRIISKTRPKGERKVIPWTRAEKEAVQRRMKLFIGRLKCPGMADCLEALEEESALSRRSWRDVKFCTHNIIQKRKRAMGM